MNINNNTWLNGNASHVSTDGEISPDTTRHVLTIEEAARLFAEGHVPRSPRTIARFCQLGDLDCIRVETEKNFKYMIDPSSVEKRIRNCSKPCTSAARHIRTCQVMSRHTTRHD